MSAALKFLLLGSLAVGAPLSAAADTLQITATTTPNGGQYAPRNVVAVWVTGPGGAFVKTIGRYADVRKQYLLAWNQAAGANDVDAVTSATRLNHAAALNITWNVLDKAGAPLPNGTYTIRMEQADQNANNAAQNRQGTFTFVKGPAAQTQSALANGGFTDVSIVYTPAPVTSACNNGALDTGETCDPALAGSCPTTCVQSADACMPSALVGTAATCTAACAVQPITTCVDDDGCCADGCSLEMDNDCGVSGEPEYSSGSCATSSSSLVFALPALALIALRRRRR